MGVPFLALTHCQFAVDENLPHPNILHPRTHSFPQTQRIARKTRIPLNFLCTPFDNHSHTTITNQAKQTLKMENGFNLCRCNTCNTYLTPGVDIHPVRFTCNFCGVKNSNKSPTTPGAFYLLLLACP